jgi:hypothetical protein
VLNIYVVYLSSVPEERTDVSLIYASWECSRQRRLACYRTTFVPLSLLILSADFGRKFSLSLQCRTTLSCLIYGSQNSSSSFAERIKVIFSQWRHLAILFPGCTYTNCEVAAVLPSGFERRSKF